MSYCFHITFCPIEPKAIDSSLQRQLMEKISALQPQPESCYFEESKVAGLPSGGFRLDYYLDAKSAFKAAEIGAALSLQSLAIDALGFTHTVSDPEFSFSAATSSK